MTLDQLRGLDGAAAAEAAWAARGPAAGPGSDCDASIVPVVSGHVDPAALDRLAAALRGQPRLRPAAVRPAIVWPVTVWLATAGGVAVRAGAADGRPGPAADPAAGRGRAVRPGGAGRVPAHGPAARPRGHRSLPLDVGKADRADPGAPAPGGDRPGPALRVPRLPAAARRLQVHHLRPRSRGGGTSLGNLLLLCAFHHLIAVHRWGWQLPLHPDATVTAVSPDGQRTLHSHGPPARAA